MAFTFVQSNAADMTNTCQLTGVTAGNLIVVWTKWEMASSNTDATVSDGTSTLTRGTLGADATSSPNGQFHYILSSVASGTVTYTATFPSSSFQRIRVAEFSYTADTIALDSQNTGHSGSADPAVSGAITIQGSDELVFGGIGEFSGFTINSRSINGSAADGYVDGSGGTQCQMWYKAFSSPFSNGTASADLNTAGAWVCNVIAFYAPATLEQEGYLWRDDDNNEASATALASQDANITRAVNTNTRLRTLINATGDPGSKSFQLEYRKVGDTEWHKIGTQ